MRRFITCTYTHISKMIMSRTMRVARHAAGMGEKSNACSILSSK
jgi:hypothetical protein